MRFRSLSHEYLPEGSTAYLSATSPAPRAYGPRARHRRQQAGGRAGGGGGAGVCVVTGGTGDRVCAVRARAVRRTFRLVARRKQKLVEWRAGKLDREGRVSCLRGNLVRRLRSVYGRPRKVVGGVVPPLPGLDPSDERPAGAHQVPHFGVEVVDQRLLVLFTHGVLEILGRRDLRVLLRWTGTAQHFPLARHSPSAATVAAEAAEMTGGSGPPEVDERWRRGLGWCGWRAEAKVGLQVHVPSRVLDRQVPGARV